MKDTIITHKGKTEKASKLIATLKDDLVRVNKLTDAFAIRITQERIDNIRAALATEGMSENTEIVTAPVAPKVNTSRARYMGGHSYTARVDRDGDINNLLRRHGQVASY